MAILIAAVLHAQGPQGAAERFLRQRGDSGGPSAARALQRARAQHLGLLGQPRAQGLTAAWQALGPLAVASAGYGKVSGRVTAVAIDTNDATGNTVYVGTTGGGVWKSLNAAAALSSVSFAPLTDTLPVFAANAGSRVIPSLSIGAVAVQPRGNPVVLAGTGDANDATDSLYGEGILRSADGGLTWTLAQGSQDGVNGNHSFLGLSVAGLAWSTATPSLVVAAMSTSVEGLVVGAAAAQSVAGLYYSADAGVTWQMAAVYDGVAPVQQPMVAVAAGNPATAVVWNALRQRFYAAVRQHGFYESADGATWKRMTNQPGTGLTTAACPAASAAVGCPMWRGALSVQPATGDLYALSVDSSNRDNGLWQDACASSGGTCSSSAPTFAHRIDAGALEAGGGSTAIAEGDYNLTLAAAPSGSGTVLFASTTDLWRCAIAAGGSSCALRNTTNAANGCGTPAMVAPAQHALATMAQVSGMPLLFAGNDGGLWRSTDGVAQSGGACNATDAQHFDNLNGALGSLAEVTGFAQHPTDANTLLVGLGENGSAATTAAAATFAAGGAWAQLSSGEGGPPLLNAASPANWYLATGAGVHLKQCALGGACTAADFAGGASVGAVQVAGDAALLDAPALLDLAATANVLVGTCRVWRGAASGAAWSAANAISKPFGGGAAPCTAASPLVRSLAAGGPAASSSNAQNVGSTVLYAGLAGTADGGGSLGGHVFVTTSAGTANSSTAWTDAALGPVTNDSVNANVFNPLGFDVSSVTVDAHDATGATVYATVMGFGPSAAALPHVYRSVDFGAHWANVSANLPDAPANALAVDPNDANTVYVALDTGVYVTTQIATCATASCWSVLGTALPNSPVTALAAAANMPTGDGRLGLLRAGTYGRGMWSIPLLSALSVQQAAMTLSATSLTFGAQQVGAQSAAQTLTVTSSGNAALTVSSVSVSGDFVESDSCAGQTVAAGSSCAMQVRFAPAATGTRTGTVTVYANVAGGQATAALTGSATAPGAVVLSPVALVFAATVVNGTSASQIVTMSNTGGTSVALGAPSVSGDFQVSANTCGTVLPAQSGCSVGIVFTPTASGMRNGTVTLTDDAGTQTATLTGTGNAPATDALSTNALTFATTQIGSISSAQQVVLSNAGDVALLLVNVAVTSGPFAATSTCGASLAAHASCVVSVAFVPTVTGAASGVLTVSDQFRSQAVALNGLGVAPPGVSLTPVAGLTFAATGVGLTTPAQAVMLTNNGGVALAIAGVAVSGDFHLASMTCGASLSPSAACTLLLVFAPTASGTRTGTLTLTDNAPGGTQTVALVGTGVDFTLTASGAASVTVASGTPAVFPMLLSSAAGLSGTVALSCSGAPAHSVCTVTPTNAALGGTVSVVTTVQTGLAQAQLSTPRFARRDEWLVLAFIAPLTLCFARKRMMRARLLLVLLVGLVATGGCGTPRDIPATGTGGTATPTPAGTYPITVSAVAAGVTHNVSLTLIVQ